PKQLACSCLLVHGQESAFYAVLPVYAKLGVPQEVVDQWKPNVEAGEPAPPLPEVQLTEGGNSESTEQTSEQSGPAPVVITSAGETAESPDYQFLHVYKTPEELAAAVKFRNESLGKVPVPWVLKARQEKK
ncbi:2582_t:CDS:2, partial [Acaulospora colombiana]